jgi:hypothetical protein
MQTWHYWCIHGTSPMEELIVLADGVEMSSRAWTCSTSSWLGSFLGARVGNRAQTTGWNHSSCHQFGFVRVKISRSLVQFGCESTIGLPKLVKVLIRLRSPTILSFTYIAIIIPVHLIKKRYDIKILLLFHTLIWTWTIEMLCRFT